MGKHVNGFSYFIVNKYIFIILFLLAGKLYGFSHMPYPDGDVNVIIKIINLVSILMLMV